MVVGEEEKDGMNYIQRIRGLEGSSWRGGGNLRDSVASSDSRKRPREVEVSETNPAEKFYHA